MNPLKWSSDMPIVKRNATLISDAPKIFLVAKYNETKNFVKYTFLINKMIHPRIENAYT